MTSCSGLTCTVLSGPREDTPSRAGARRRSGHVSIVAQLFGEEKEGGGRGGQGMGEEGRG